MYRIRRIWHWLCVTLVVTTLAACGGGGASTVARAPDIAAQPADVAVSEGLPARFSVTANGTGSLNYQWQRDGVDIVGATAATYTIDSVTEADNNAQFRVVVTNSIDRVTSNVATLTINVAAALPTIVSQPVSITVAPGTDASFRVEVDGTPPLRYQWQRDGADIPGATAATHTLASSASGDSGAVFRVLVSNGAGSLTSVDAQLTVDASGVAPSIVTQPQSVHVADGSLAVLSVAATGTVPFSYQWRRNGQDIFGATGSTFITPALALTDSGVAYNVLVSNGTGSTTSASATLTVTPMPLAWSAQPAATSVAQGQTAQFAATASGSQPITYQWKRNGVDIGGATGASYTTPAATLADDGAQYTVVAANPAGSLISAPAGLAVVAAPVAPSIATAPADLGVSVGQVASFTVAAAGTAPLTYQWLRNGTAIAGATAAAYTTAAATLADNAAQFSVRVSNAAGNVTSAAAVLTVQAVDGPLDGRAWATAQPLETDDNLVQDRASGIDDAGRVMVVFRKSNGSRDVIYATRGTPNAAGTAPSWSPPVVIDLLAGIPVSSMATPPDFGLTVTPGGNALAYWYHRAPCTASTYNTSGTCRYYYMARYSAAADAWSAPELIADASAPGFKAVLNDRGDVALFGTSWIRSGTNSRTAALALFSRGAGQATMTRQLMNAVPLGAWAFDMDAAGNLLLVAEAQQNATTDLVAYRGTAEAGLGAQQILDTRGAAATLVTGRVGLNGQQVVIWRQNNGTAASVFAAASTTPAGPFSVQELGTLALNITPALTVADDGNAQLLNRFNRWRVRWVAGAWEAAANLPSDVSDSSFLTCAHARNGNFLCIASSAFGEGNTGRWATYDASRNVMVQAFLASRPSTGYVLGVNTINRGVGYESPVLSVGGIGATTLRNQYDVLPTAAVPAGDGRNVTNLWGAFLR